MTKRQKSKINENVPLMDIPLQILEKYKETLPDGAILPVLSNQKINTYLKEIADVCEIDKNLTFHVARHTFATTALTNGMPMETLSKVMGHTNIKTTQIYARVVDAKVSQDMKALAHELRNLSPSINTNLENRNELDRKFECLTGAEKMELFRLPQTLSIDNEREKRIANLWYSLSDEEKDSLWTDRFDNTRYLQENRRVLLGK